MQANPRTSEAAQAARNAGRAVAGAQRSAAYYNERFNQPRIPGGGGVQDAVQHHGARALTLPDTCTTEELIEAANDALHRMPSNELFPLKLLSVSFPSQDELEAAILVLQAAAAAALSPAYELLIERPTALMLEAKLDRSCVLFICAVHKAGWQIGNPEEQLRSHHAQGFWWGQVVIENLPYAHAITHGYRDVLMLRNRLTGDAFGKDQPTTMDEFDFAAEESMDTDTMPKSFTQTWGQTGVQPGTDDGLLWRIQHNLLTPFDADFIGFMEGDGSMYADGRLSCEVQSRDGAYLESLAHSYGGSLAYRSKTEQTGDGYLRTTYTRVYTWRPADEELRAELLELLPPGKSEDGVFTNAHSCRILELMSTPMLAAAFVEGFMRADGGLITQGELLGSGETGRRSGSISFVSKSKEMLQLNRVLAIKVVRASHPLADIPPGFLRAHRKPTASGTSYKYEAKAGTLMAGTLLSLIAKLMRDAAAEDPPVRLPAPFKRKDDLLERLLGVAFPNPVGAMEIVDDPTNNDAFWVFWPAWTDEQPNAVQDYMAGEPFMVLKQNGEHFCLRAQVDHIQGCGNAKKWVGRSHYASDATKRLVQGLLQAEAAPNGVVLAKDHAVTGMTCLVPLATLVAQLVTARFAKNASTCDQGKSHAAASALCQHAQVNGAMFQRERDALQIAFRRAVMTFGGATDDVVFDETIKQDLPKGTSGLALAVTLLFENSEVEDTVRDHGLAALAEALHKLDGKAAQSKTVELKDMVAKAATFGRYAQDGHMTRLYLQFRRPDDPDRSVHLQLGYGKKYSTKNSLYEVEVRLWNAPLTEFGDRMCSTGQGSYRAQAQ